MLSAAYEEIKRLRSRGDCAAAVSALHRRPPASDEDAFEAAVCLFVCGDLQTAAHVCRTYAWKTQWAHNIAQALADMLGGGTDRALPLARTAVADPAAPYDASAIYLLLLKKEGQIEEATEYIARRLQNPPPGETFLLTIMAEITVAAGDWRKAYQLASAVLSADPDDYHALMVLGTANYEVGNYHEALGNALRANLLHPGWPASILLLMRCHNQLGDYYAAIAAFEQLGDKSVASSDLRVELGTAYAGLEELEHAIAEYRAALAAEQPPSMTALRALVKIYALAGRTAELDALVETYPDEIRGDLECTHLRGLERLARGDLDRAARLFADSFALARHSAQAAKLLPWPVPEPRIRHDYEQLELLARRGRLDGAGREALRVLGRYYDQTGDPGRVFAPDGAEGEALENALCAIHHVPALSFEGRALGDNDYGAIEEKYFAEKLVVIDGFLSPEALAALRCFCEEATIWKMYNGRGYVGALLAQGFSPKVLLAIAHELKQAMPRVIGDHPLMQAWGFKYDQRMQGIDMHADFAKVNVNFWITPDEACADPATGGLVVYDLPVPKHWTFADYNSDPEKLKAYLKVHDARAVRVPYRENRCVLFDSSLVHVTDELKFKPGYENRRVNITLLYGKARTVG
jgi:tetratricopeptide (TPR) repeat protein